MASAAAMLASSAGSTWSGPNNRIVTPSAAKRAAFSWLRTVATTCPKRARFKATKRPAV
jgi:hypothetical protein